MRIIYFIISFNFILISCQENGSVSYLDNIYETEQYLDHHKMQDEHGISWPIYPDDTLAIATNLYSGTPGIILFYLELFNQTQDSAFLHNARDGINYLVSTIPDSIPQTSQLGLYTGLAGVGFTILEIYRFEDSDTYLRAANQIIDILGSAAQSTENGIEWEGYTDIVYGAAGIGFFLQYAAQQIGSKKAANLAEKIAWGLIDMKIDSLDGVTWRMMPGYQRIMDNFSHGAAGIAYYLSESFKLYDEPIFLEIAEKTAEYLLGQSNREGFVCHHKPGGEELFYLSWCHGPPGTAKLYFSLYEITGEQKWMDAITLAANSIMELGLYENRTDGFWNNVGICCGTAGVAKYFLWLYRITGHIKYVNQAIILTDDILNRAQKEENHLKWVHAENRGEPDKVFAQTGYMQGSAGIGLWLLEMDAFINDRNFSIHLPDE